MLRQVKISTRVRPLIGAMAIAAALALAQGSAAAAALPDGRGWEMVSPVLKGGGAVSAYGSPAAALAGEGAFRAAAAGGAFAYPSAASFGEAAGAAPISQYVAERGGDGWSSANLTPPLLSGTYEGDPYLFFAADLSRGILTNGWSCRGGAETCEAENPPLSPQAPAGYRDLYLHEGGTYTPLITKSNFPGLPADPSEFSLALEGASPDARHVVISIASQLYEWSGGTLTAIGAPESVLAAPEGAVSEDGSRVYYSALEDGPYYLYESGQAPKAIPGTTGGAASFGAATADGAHAFFVEGGSLVRYDAASEQVSAPLASEVQQIAAISPDGSYVYYVATGGLYLLHGGASTKLLAASPSHLPPTSGVAAATGGDRLFFTSPDRLLSADTDGRPDAYEWEGEGIGSCSGSPGCIFLISSGRVGEARFLGASSDGSDAYFLTDASLVAADPEADDVYDARIGGGFPEPPSPIPCDGDACQGPAPGPEDPTPGTATFEGPENPPLPVAKKHHRKKKHKHHRHRKAKR